MSVFTFLYNEILYRPLFNGLIFLYNIAGHDFGIAIIILTLVIRGLLYPLSQKAIKSQKEMQELQPKIKEVQQKYKGDREKQSLALMALYKEHKVNPASGCFPILIQLPILFALFSVFRHGFDPSRLSALYSFVANPGVINPVFLGLIDLSKKSLVLALFAGVTQFIQTKMITPKSPKEGSIDFAGMMSKQMLYIFPVLMVYIGYSVPGGLALYWVVFNIFAIVQQYFGLSHRLKQPKDRQVQ